MVTQRWMSSALLAGAVCLGPAVGEASAHGATRHVVRVQPVAFAPVVLAPVAVAPAVVAVPRYAPVPVQRVVTRSHVGATRVAVRVRR